MNKIQLLKEPGYIYDLNFIFCLKFNTQLYIDALPEDDEKEKNIAFFNDISSQFGDIPDDLYLFFHANEAGHAFLPTYYFNPYRDQIVSTYNFNFLQKELSNQNILMQNMIKFYFPNITPEEIEICINSTNKIFKYIKNSSYSDIKKSKLYEFFMFPSEHIQSLQYELMSKEFILSSYYKNNYQKIIDIHNQTTYEVLYDQLSHLRNIDFLNNKSQTLYTSYCLLNKNLIAFDYISNGVLALLGYDYISVISHIKNEKQELDLCALGSALNEESRTKILNFILKQGEVSCKDLEKEFSFSGSTAYHHLAIMTKSNLLKNRNQGKTILYSLNKKYISSVIKTFKNMLNTKGPES